MREQAASNEDVIALRSQMYADLSHRILIINHGPRAPRPPDAACYHRKRMARVPERTDFIVVGAGVAGLRAAIALAEAGRVLVLAKQELTESNTQYAQGGVAVALSDEDEVGLHLKDTIVAGDGIVNEAAARVLVEEGPARIQELLEWGTHFDLRDNKLAFTREGAHSRSRILHAHGDSTGREMGRALYAKARTLSNIEFRAFEFTTELMKSAGRVAGVRVIDNQGNRFELQASAVLLATGGAGQVYRDTTNPAVATGDGIAMAYRAGAAVSDMEFVQFHPTALAKEGAPRFLLSEALRGEGAYLLNQEQARFMPEYHKQAELAPRDVVARAITKEILKSNVHNSSAFLDLRHLDAKLITQRFPRIHATCLRHGIDITTDLIPVRPAAHYLMGGVKTDLAGHTSLPGLYAAGEAACTGVHGANRLASNSLLEGLVFGARAGEAMRQEAGRNAGTPEPTAEWPPNNPSPPEQVIKTVQNVMWRHAGVLRDGDGLGDAIAIIQTLRDRLPAPASRLTCEAHNIRRTAWLILKSAIARQESRGAHFRADFPKRDDKRFRKNSVLEHAEVRFEP